MKTIDEMINQSLINISDLPDEEGQVVYYQDAVFIIKEYSDQKFKEFREFLLKEGYSGIASLFDEWLEKEGKV